MAGIIAAEAAAKNDVTAPPPATEPRELQDPASLTLFVTWYTMGGYRNPPTPAEIAAWPEAWLHDWPLLFGRLQQARHNSEAGAAQLQSLRDALKGN